MNQRKRYVVVGTGGRGIGMFAKPLLRKFTEYCELVGLFDHNPLRLAAANDLLEAKLPAYTDFDVMLREAKPDAIIVATRDCTHAQYIIRGMAAGKRVMSEKPLCVDAKQCREILDAAKRYKSIGGHCFVTHNMRYGPTITELKRLIDTGAVGKVLTVNFHENLDRRHGADYFRRWHRMIGNSGGLLIHKASHHFDTLNWLISAKPVTLVAQGGLMFYGKNGPFRHTRCEGCPHSSKCEFFADMWKNEHTRRLYKDAESADGYLRDGCVFDPKIDIVDQAAVLYTYDNGVRVTYSLTAFASYEGWYIQIEGTDGRLELREVHDTSWASGGSIVAGTDQLAGQKLMLYSRKEGIKDLPIPTAEGTHGGADSGIEYDFFGRPWDAPLTVRQAPLEQAVQAVLIGHAANVSMAEGSRVIDVQGMLR